MDWRIAPQYEQTAAAVLFHGDRLEWLRQLPEGSAQLIVTSPPYNIGKEYEERTALQDYLRRQEETICASVQALANDGSICWQVGNHVDSSELFPLDALLYPLFKKFGLKLRNRVIWHFEHGLHCSRRFSGRHETILWFTKSEKYKFHLDRVRVPQKYPGKKAFKGPKRGQYTCNPLGKNPGDVWLIPNVKHNHIEKTIHPCQFPIELIERLVLALTDPGELVVDPYVGVGSAVCAAVLNDRRGVGSDTSATYLRVAKTRVVEAFEHRLPRRPMTRPVYIPDPRSKLARKPTNWEYPTLPLDTAFAND